LDKSDSGFRIQDSGFRIQDSGFRIQDSGFRIQDSPEATFPLSFVKGGGGWDLCPVPCAL
jgi:hypothetical protein